MILLIGAALGVKYAFDQHWFASLPIWIWPSIIAACGFALIGAGEYVYRKVNVVPAASCSRRDRHALPRQLHRPFVLRHLLTVDRVRVDGPDDADRIGVAMRGKMVSIAVLSLIGGNIAPLVMGGTGHTHSTFMAYLLMLQAIALVLAWWGRSRRWWMLADCLWRRRRFGRRDHRVASRWHDAAGFRDRLRDSLSRGGDRVGDAGRSKRSDGRTTPSLFFPNAPLEHGGTTFVVLVMAGLTAAVLSCPARRRARLRARALARLVKQQPLSARTLVASQSRSADHAVAGAGVRRPAEIALLLLAVPVAFNGMSVEIGWALMAIAMALVGDIEVCDSQVGPVVAWICALSAPDPDPHRVSMRSAHHHVVKIWMTFDGVAMHLALSSPGDLALVGHLIAGLHRTDSDRFESGQHFLGLIRRRSSSSLRRSSRCRRWGDGEPGRICVGLLISDIPMSRMNLAMQSIGVLLLATAKWVVIDTLAQRCAGVVGDAGSADPQSADGVGLLLACSLVGAYWLRRASIKLALPDQRHAPLAATVSGVVVVALVAIGFSFEIDRVVERALLSGNALSWPRTATDADGLDHALAACPRPSWRGSFRG